MLKTVATLVVISEGTFIRLPSGNFVKKDELQQSKISQAINLYRIVGNNSMGEEEMEKCGCVTVDAILKRQVRR